MGLEDILNFFEQNLPKSQGESSFKNWKNNNLAEVRV